MPHIEEYNALYFNPHYLFLPGISLVIFIECNRFSASKDRHLEESGIYYVIKNTLPDPVKSRFFAVDFFCYSIFSLVLTARVNLDLFYILT